MAWAHGKDGGFEGFEGLCVFFFVEVYEGAVLFVDEFIVALLVFAGLDGLNDPFFELESLAVGTAI
jgi:hypothetical protein